MSRPTTRDMARSVELTSRLHLPLSHPRYIVPLLLQLRCDSQMRYSEYISQLCNHRPSHPERINRDQQNSYGNSRLFFYFVQIESCENGYRWKRLRCCTYTAERRGTSFSIYSACMRRTYARIDGNQRTNEMDGSYIIFVVMTFPYIFGIKLRGKPGWSISVAILPRERDRVVLHSPIRQKCMVEAKLTRMTSIDLSRILASSGPGYI